MKKTKESPIQPESTEQLKAIAQQFSQYFNNQYKENVSYTPDTETIASVSVSKWLEMPDAIQDAIELPGLPMGNITCVYGKPDTGKTTFLQMGIASCVKKGVLPVLILTEHKFDFNRLSKFMNTNPDNILVFHADNIEQGYKYIEKILRAVKSGKLTYETAEGQTIELDISQLDVFIFWDSIGNTLSETELEYDIEDWDKSMGKAAKAIKTLTKRVNQLLGKVRQRVGICFLNQSYMSMPSYGPSIETPYGGDGVPYSSALVLRFRRVRDLDMTVKGKDIVIGLETKIEVKKNHISHKKPTTTVYTTAMGMLPATKEALEEYKKAIR